MYLFFHTKTSWPINYAQPVSHENQPHLVQLGVLLWDFQYREVGALDCLIQPAGYSYTEAAMRLNGIDPAQAETFGISLRTAVTVFQQFVLRAKTIAAFNYKFHSKVMLIQGSRVKRGLGLHAVAHACVKEMVAPKCPMPSDRKGKTRPPELTEAAWNLLEERLDGKEPCIEQARYVAQLWQQVRTTT